MISLAHIGLVAFGLARMRARPGPGARTRYVWAPRTSFWIGRLTGREREAQAASDNSPSRQE